MSFHSTNVCCANSHSKQLEFRSNDPDSNAGRAAFQSVVMLTVLTEIRHGFPPSSRTLSYFVFTVMAGEFYWAKASCVRFVDHRHATLGRTRLEE